MDLERETTMVILLNQYNFPQHSKYLPLYPQVNVVLSPQRGNFSFQQIGDHYRKPRWVKTQLQSTVVPDTATNPALQVQESL